MPVLSRNWATVVLERSQIIDRDDIYSESDPKHAMTDGGGRISPALAERIARYLGLAYTPSGFQGRIGEAKGFWTVDYSDKSEEEWIETRTSQRKWIRSTEPDGVSEHEWNRTFEVVGYSGPLQSKALNKQILPLLMDRAKDPKAMKKALEALTTESLARDVEALQAAMESPLVFRKWLYGARSNIAERLKAGGVTYRAGVPYLREERLVMLLDGGFCPKTQFFAKDLARKIFKSNCDEMVDKLKITVEKSASVYMVPDFWGVLEPDEVYINFSTFSSAGESFDSSSIDLSGKEILVTRSPAHFPSDIQKVRVIDEPKRELFRLKDVIVFSTKGVKSLAWKLSGGDYDGDRAWICWEPSIVNNFESANVPECENLVKMGYIHKDSRTYGQLIHGQVNASAFFLENAFAFSVQPALLGRCTEHKDAVCWTQKSVSTPEVLLLSTLLSSLVDQAKQGLTFTEEDWTRFKNDLIKVTAQTPSYKKSGSYGLDRNSGHIIDRLQCLTSDHVEVSLTKLHESIPEPDCWDEDLLKLYQSAKMYATTNDEWKELLDYLNAKLTSIKSRWTTYWAKEEVKKAKKPVDETTEEPYFIIDACCEEYESIQLHVDTPFTQLLLPRGGDPAQSEWELVKASLLYSMCSKKSLLPWWMGGEQLIRLKGRYGGSPRVHTVISSMYAGLKPDTVYIKRYMSGIEGAIPVEDGAANLDDEDSDEGEGEDD
jgi:RNA dependent RNA polymerase